MTPEKKGGTVFFYVDGEVTPLSLAKSIIESDIFRGKDFREFVDYLGVHVKYHCQHGIQKESKE